MQSVRAGVAELPQREGCDDMRISVCPRCKARGAYVSEGTDNKCCVCGHYEWGIRQAPRPRRGKFPRGNEVIVQFLGRKRKNEKKSLLRLRYGKEQRYILHYRYIVACPYCLDNGAQRMENGHRHGQIEYYNCTAKHTVRLRWPANSDDPPTWY